MNSFGEYFKFMYLKPRPTIFGKEDLSDSFYAGYNLGKEERIEELTKERDKYRDALQLAIAFMEEFNLYARNKRLAHLIVELKKAKKDADDAND